MDTDVGRSPASQGRAATPSEPSPAVSGKAGIPNADSGNLRGYFGILNKRREFWSHTVHGSRKEAQDYIRAFWGRQTDMARACLRDFQIIEVRVRLEPLQIKHPEQVSA